MPRQIITVLVLAFLLACGACANTTPAQTAAAASAVTLGASVAGTIDPQVAAFGTLFCKLGPKFFAVANVTVPNQPKEYVDAACAGIDPAAVPTPVPTTSTPVPLVTVPVPTV